MRQPPFLLGGPVLYWEMVRATRRIWPYVLRYGFGFYLLMQLLVQWNGLNSLLNEEENARRSNPDASAAHLHVHAGRTIAQWGNNYVRLLFMQQLALLLFATPAVTAGALGDEKERGTLSFLFATELRSHEIVFGKMLGRLAVLGNLMLINLPILLFMAGMAGLALHQLLLPYLQAVVITFAWAAAAMVSSVYTRHTRDAILGCYAGGVLVFLSAVTVLDETLPTWLNPFEVLQRIATPPYGIATRNLVGHFAAFGGTGIVCIILAIRKLRSVSLGQLEGKTKRFARFLERLRPRVGNSPVYWRERYLIGLAPLPFLRTVPRWMGMLGVFSFSVILVYTALSQLTHYGLRPRLFNLEFKEAYKLLTYISADRVTGEVIVMGIILAILGTLVVGVRCAGSVTEERRNRTWDDLIITPLTVEQIAQAKLVGILGATIPYLIAFMIPMVGFACIGGPAPVFVAIGFVIGTAFTMFIAALVGMGYSVGSEDR